MLLNYKVMGEGVPLLILHGFLGSLDNWQSIAKDLSNNYKVYLLDMRNHGKSGHSDAHNYTLMQQDVLQFMKDQNIAAAHILGHSMGGKVAMFFATQHPEKVDQLIVVDIGPKYYPPHHLNILSALQAVNLPAINSRQEAERILMEHLNDAGIVQWLMKNLKRENGESFSWKFNLNGLAKEVENIGEALPTNAYFPNPTLFIRGGRSNYILDEDLETIAQHFPAAILSTVSLAGHWVHAEQPEEFVALIRNFLKNH